MSVLQWTIINKESYYNYNQENTFFDTEEIGVLKYTPEILYRFPVWGQEKQNINKRYI